jgi:heat shock protein HspQ
MATPPRKRATPSLPTQQDAPQSSSVKPSPTKRLAAKPVTAKPTPAAVTKLAAKATAKPLTKLAKPAELTEVAAKPKPRKASTKTAATVTAPKAGLRHAKFSVGAVVKHRVYPFRGVVFDIDPVFNNTEDWWQAIPEEIRPRKDQPFYHLLAENAETTYVAYVSEQNLLADKTGQPVRHPQVKEMFALDGKGQYRARFLQSH